MSITRDDQILGRRGIFCTFAYKYRRRTWYGQPFSCYRRAGRAGGRALLSLNSASGGRAVLVSEGDGQMVVVYFSHPPNLI